MLPWILFLVLSTFLNEGSGQIVTCYYRPSLYFDNNLEEQNITDHLEIDKCSHLIYDEMGLDDTLWRLSPRHKENFQKVLDKKVVRPDLKILPVLQVSDIVHKILSQPPARIYFPKHIEEFIKENKLDGLTVSWIPPETPVAQQFYEFLKNLRKIFDESKLMIIFTINSYILDTYNIASLKDDFDFICPLSFPYYDRDWKKMGVTLPVYPLFSKIGERSGLKNSILHLEQLGVHPLKFLLPISFLGVEYVVKGQSEGKFGEAIESYTKKNFTEICHLNKTWSHHWDEVSKTPLLTNGSKVISYENSRSISEKIKYTKGSVGGVNVLLGRYDNVQSTCSENELKTTVIDNFYEKITGAQRTVKEGFLDSTSITNPGSTKSDVNNWTLLSSICSLLSTISLIIIVLLLIYYLYLYCLVNNIENYGCTRSFGSKSKKGFRSTISAPDKCRPLSETENNYETPALLP